MRTAVFKMRVMTRRDYEKLGRSERPAPQRSMDCDIALDSTLVESKRSAAGRTRDRRKRARQSERDQERDHDRSERERAFVRRAERGDEDDLRVRMGRGNRVRFPRRERVRGARAAFRP
jgi:hypothetical protein